MQRRRAKSRWRNSQVWSRIERSSPSPACMLCYQENEAPGRKKKRAGRPRPQAGSQRQKDADNVQIAFQVSLLDGDTRLMNNQIDAVKGSVDRGSVLSLFGVLRVVSVDLSPLITPHRILTVMSRSVSITIENDVVVLTVGMILCQSHK